MAGTLAPGGGAQPWNWEWGARGRPHLHPLQLDATGQTWRPGQASVTQQNGCPGSRRHLSRAWLAYLMVHRHVGWQGRSWQGLHPRGSSSCRSVDCRTALLGRGPWPCEFTSINGLLCAWHRDSESGVRTWGGGLGTLAPQGPAWGSCLTVPQSHLVSLAGTPCCKPQEGRVFLGKGVGS